MRLTTLLAPLALAGPALAGLFGGSDSTTAASAASTSPSSSSSSSSDSSNSSDASSTQSANPQVAFLQTLQSAQISSMSCLITLVNLTTTPLGSCLGLTTLSSLISAPPTNQSFSDGLSGYLGGVCGETCSEGDLGEGKRQLEESCSGQAQGGGGLVGVLGKVIDNYSTSYRTLACQVHYNGTADLCLPSVLNSSSAANSNTFFDALVSGDTTTLEGYADSVFGQASCTGCMYEMYKAAVYTTPSIRGQDLTTSLGDHLKNSCPADPDTGSTVNWDDVEDQQIPDALQVSQNTQTGTSSARRRAGVGGGWGVERWGGGWEGVGVVVGVVVGLGVGGVGMI
ncbi:hypothetical protein IAT38_006756 [Cryptococcus sp. DSM 104549]